MSDIAIKIENLSKKYVIGAKDDRFLYERISNGFKSLFSRNGKQQETEFWALRDINLEIKQGDVVGIIGKNGAGKSTLLKIISRITQPTTGRVTIKGKVASILEVGTGMNRELTGRENIFINGAILGMKQAEIRKKFDEIVAFSGVEKFIDTPIKHYSSGMYVRLAFAIAAHLEPDILIIDEVLAVGDAEFQKKCLGKMNDVSRKEGRTVLFVSHNMTAVRGLCSRAILLQNGMVLDEGKVEHVIESYMDKAMDDLLEQNWTDISSAPGNDAVKVKCIRVVPELASTYISVETPIRIFFEFWNFMQGASLNLSMHLYTLGGELIFAAVSPSIKMNEGLASFTCFIPANFLNDGKYTISMMIVNHSKAVYTLNDAVRFEVHDVRDGEWFGKWPGAVRPKFEWQFSQMNEQILKE